MNPRLQIETPRLVLRLPQPEDVRAVQLAIQLTLPELARWMPRAVKGQTQAQTRAYIYTQMALYVQDENLTFGLFGRESGACMGIIELGSRVPRIPSWEMSFWTRSDVAGQGLMTEAARHLSDYAFTHMNARRLFGRTEPENIGSQQVLLRAGYVQEGVMRNDALDVNNLPVDTLVFGRVA